MFSPLPRSTPPQLHPFSSRFSAVNPLTHGAPNPRFGVQSELDDLYASTVEARQRLVPYLDLLRLPHQPEPISGAVTPLQTSRRLPGLFYKREDLTATRAYKVRGALVAMSRAMERGEQEFVTVSTGNHAMGILKAAEILRPKFVQVVIPENVLKPKQDKLLKKIEALKLRGVGARLVLHGSTFEEARGRAQGLSGHYIDPYADLDVISGQGTIGLELAEQLFPLLKSSEQVDELDVIVPVGGGGLVTGTGNALSKALKNEHGLRPLKVRIIGLRLENLDSPHGDAIRVKQLDGKTVERLKHLGVHLWQVPDEDIAHGLSFAQGDLQAHVEGASGAAVAPVLCHADCVPNPQRLTVSIISGGNVAENE